MLIKFKVQCKSRAKYFADIKDAFSYGLSLEKLGYEIDIYLNSNTIYTACSILIYKTRRSLDNER